MNLLFDQNLSFRLCEILAGVFPDSVHVRLVGLDNAPDLAVWNYVCDHGLALVSKDADFAEMAALFGPPPKVIWLRCGNQPTSGIAVRLSANAESLQQFELDENACIELY